MPDNMPIQQKSPNPTHEKITLNFSLSAKQPVTIKIHTLYGGEIYSQMTEGTSGSNIKELLFDNRELAAGIYLISIITQEGQMTRRMIVTH